ncbi:protein LMBR1L-like isoform X2 [Lethenteron reissneri]|uniref:protein LMBR1L-like isoform X2 n=1 Tax=Lethenteron reissneri TaxID=7753 RepID=UPI002AB61A7A|nr:protein LMBR1L-like isoform X2 [Lethenteron reissneri]
MASRGCKHPADAFCYVCGQFIKARAKEYSVEASAKMGEAYKAYFGMPVGDQDKPWAPHFTCEQCKTLWKICFLLFTFLYITSYLIITRFKKRTDFILGDDEDAMVNRIALWMCTFTLAVSLAAALLLPFSIVSNEVLLSLPHNYYMQWLNGSLVHGLWNLVFLCSNLSLVLLMPFAYFFIESEGFTGSRKGVMGRVYEAAVVLCLLVLLVFGMVWVASSIIDKDPASTKSRRGLWDFYLPYLYSCISLFGVLLLLVCTPLGLSRMFGVTGQLLVKPRLLENLDEQIECSRLEEAVLKRRLKGRSGCWQHLSVEALRERIFWVSKERNSMERRVGASVWQRNLCFPLVMLLLLLLTGVSVVLVCFHVLVLLIDDAAMPKGSQEVGFGKASLSAFGPLGATLEVALIFYLMVSSVVGFYSLPHFCTLLPRNRSMPMTKIIGNCVSLLVLSSALPVLSRTLGITNFDLLGNFGRFNWLGNFHIVLSYNLLFAGLSTLCLVRTFTATVRRELLRALGLSKLLLPQVSVLSSPMAGKVHQPGCNQSSSNHQPSTYQPSSTSNHQPSTYEAITYQPSSTSNHQPNGTSHHQPSTYQPSSTSNHHPSTYEAIAYQPSRTYQFSSNFQLSSTQPCKYQSSVVELNTHQPSNNQANSSEPCSTYIGNHQPSTHQPCDTQLTSHELNAYQLSSTHPWRDIERDTSRNTGRVTSRNAGKGTSRDAGGQSSRDIAGDTSRDTGRDASRDAGGDAFLSACPALAVEAAAALAEAVPEGPTMLPACTSRPSLGGPAAPWGALRRRRALSGTYDQGSMGCHTWALGGHSKPLHSI